MTTETTPLVSIVLPVYNVEPWLGECLDSVVSQTLRDLEIVCVNDGSTDGSPAVLEAYAGRDGRIRIIRQENQGLSAARNTGARSARGKYLYFMDSDDLLVPEAMELCAEKMERQQLQFLTFNAAAFGEDAQTIRKAGEWNRGYFKRRLDDEAVLSGPELYGKLKRDGSYITTVWSCMLLRRVFLGGEHWFHPGILHEDEPWTFITMMDMERCGCLSRILYRYRIREGSIAQSAQAFRHVWGIFCGYMDVRCFLAQRPDLMEGEDMAALCLDHSRMMQSNVIRAYRALSEEGKEKRLDLPPAQRMMFEENVVLPASLMDGTDTRDRALADLQGWCDQLKDALEILRAENGRLRAELAASREERDRLGESVQALRSSVSFRLGNRMISVPSKLLAIRKRLFAGDGRESPREADASTEEGNRVLIRPSTVEGRRIVYHFEVMGEWRVCFQNTSTMEAEYPFPLENVPESVRIIPLLAQLAPASWVCDAQICVPECDEDFYRCLNEVRDGFRQMYPGLALGGSLVAERLVPRAAPGDGQGAIVCFSGGVDAMYTALCHLEEKPCLVSLWGADVRRGQEEQWQSVEACIRDHAQKLGLRQLTVRTGLRELLVEDQLARRVLETKEGWWHGFQHGLGILGHMAPVAWHEGSGTVYMASSFTAEDGRPCASDPRTDNHVRFCGARAVHDGFDADRQEKIRRIVAYSREHHLSFSLHVCWESSGGENCCHCEKCWRTMIALLAEDADPRDFGFRAYAGLQPLSGDLQDAESFYHGTLVANYLPIQRRLRSTLREEEVPKELLWLYRGNLARLEQGTLRLRDGRLLPPVWVLGTAEHSNMGDQAITETGNRYLQSLFPDTHIMEATEEELIFRQYAQLRDIPEAVPVFLQGGGNLGNLWPSPENVREEVIRRLPGHPVIILPQSIYFSGDEEGRAALARAREVYRGDHILLCCRDRVSLDFAREHFACPSVLVPDMVMWEAWKGEAAPERYGVLKLMRGDKERHLTDRDSERIDAVLAERFRSVETYDTVLTSVRVTPENRTQELDRLKRLISSAECVVTDRLHGMVFSAVTGTPCVAFRNGYHKVDGGFEWLKELGYIRLIDTPGELGGAMEEVMGCTDRRYPEEKLRAQFAALTAHLEAFRREGLYDGCRA